jgi:hypothetical protein
LFDAFVRGIYKGKILDDDEFTLFELDEKGDVVEVQYQGAWLLVDNGYLNWPTTVPPFNRTIHYKEIRFSQWLESVRKDVECTFGIMKGRFRILKTGIQIHGVKATDKVWLTCCALRNYLLEVNGLDKDWMHGGREIGEPPQCMVEGKLGNHHSADVAEHGPNFAIGWLNSPEDMQDMRSFDVSGMGPATDVEDSGEAEEHVGENPAPGERTVPVGWSVSFVNCVCHILEIDMLVEHFDILFRQNKIKWPT